MELELAILSFLRKRENFNRYSSVMDERFFGERYSRETYRLICDFFKDYPDKAMVSKRNLKLLVTATGDDKKVLYELIGNLSSKVDEDLVTNKLKEFVRDGMARCVIREELPALEGKRPFDVTKLLEQLQHARDVTIGTETIYDYTSETESFHRSYGPAGDPIATGIELLDETLRIPPVTGEEWIIIGPPGRGKTQLLLNVVGSAAMQGKTALYVTAGDQGRIRVCNRLDSIVSGIPWWRLEEERARGLLVKRLKRNVISKGGQILVQDWSETSCTPAQVVSLIEALGGVDLVAVDYPDIMRPNRRYAERRHEIASIFSELRQAAIRYNSVFWCGSQANRSALDKLKITMKEVAEDIQKCWVADGILTFCQTEEEKEESMGRLMIVKARRPPLSMYEIPISIDDETGRIE